MEGGREMSELQVPPSLLCFFSGLLGFESAISEYLILTEGGTDVIFSNLRFCSTYLLSQRSGNKREILFVYRN